MHKTRLPTEDALSAQSVNLIVKRRVAVVGLESERYSAHSLRAGFVTDAFCHGASTHAVIRQTGHRPPATIQIYAREYNTLIGNAVDDIGL